VERGVCEKTRQRNKVSESGSWESRGVTSSIPSSYSFTNH
jgi:hypothetical protein